MEVGRGTERNTRRQEIERDAVAGERRAVTGEIRGGGRETRWRERWR